MKVKITTKQRIFIHSWVESCEYLTTDEERMRAFVGLACAMDWGNKVDAEARAIRARYKHSNTITRLNHMV